MVRIASYGPQIDQSHGENRLSHIIKLVICNNTKDYFSLEPEKINVKFHKECENTAKILKISCIRCHFVKFDIYFLGLSWEIFFGVKFSLVKNVKRMRYCLLVQGFRPLKIKTTQFCWIPSWKFIFSMMPTERKWTRL